LDQKRYIYKDQLYLVIKTLDPDPYMDPDPDSDEMLDPDPDSINPVITLVEECFKQKGTSLLLR
jgi:hypothetical protein